MSPPTAQGHYRLWAAHEDLVVTAGITPRKAGVLVATGLVGGELDFDQAAAAARVAARNAVAVLVDAAGDVDRVTSLLRLSVFIACVDGFDRHSQLADVVSAQLETSFGGLARPARSAIGVRSLPGNAPIEIELTAVVRRSR